MPQSATLEVAAEVVAAFVSNTPVPKGELPALIQTVHDTLSRLLGEVETVEIPVPKEEVKEPAVSIRKSITPEYLICLGACPSNRFFEGGILYMGHTIVS